MQRPPLVGRNSTRDGIVSIVELGRDGEIAIVLVDNPPVNALKHEVRAGLAEAFSRARDDAGVSGIVLACAGRTFIAGADITEFDKPPQSPHLMEVIALMESIRKPIVAAIHGTALGGGLEIALGCHFRVAAPSARLGLPEIKLGLIPGAGGTQRLPRLIGIEKALPMILAGDAISATQALEYGLIDAIVEGELTGSAAAFARQVLRERRPLRRARDLDDKLAPMRADPSQYDELVARLSKRTRGLEAPQAAIQAVRWAFEIPFNQAEQQVRGAFHGLRQGEESKAQRYAFFAEREAAKVPGLPAGTRPREIAKAAVIGAGTMGGGIAMCFANAGIPVIMAEVEQKALERGKETIARNYRTTVSRGGLSQQEMDRRIGLIRGVTDFGAIADADIVVEAVFEEMDLKKRVFGDLDRIAKPTAVLATNTSYLDVNAIAQSTTRPASVLGTHFFSPANVMRLLEIVRGDATAPDVLATAMAVGRRIGKVPVVVGVCHGFVGNRMLRARSIEAERMLLEGALPQEIDAAITEFGFPMGPFAMGDLAGLDVSWRMRKAQGVRAEIADQLCEMGRYGQKTGKGFYTYAPNSRTPQPDPDVERLIVDTSARLGVRRRPIERTEIIERLIYPMINEGARILDEKIAARPGDIDVIWIYGYGWPVWRGGPMFYADRVGLPRIGDRLQEIATRSNDKRLEPAPLLSRLASENRGFASLGDDS
jgi:3-hydroxyacyl-CoA dehydrogenase